MIKVYELTCFVDWDTLRENQGNKNLPRVFTHNLFIDTAKHEQIEDKLRDDLVEKYGFLIRSVDFEINAVSVLMTDIQKKRYISQTYTENEWIEIFEDIKDLPWTIKCYTDVPDGTYECDLIVHHKDGSISVEDELSKDYAEEIIKGVF